jgi:predicted NBD/HSP70 family sugar kinase
MRLVFDIGGTNMRVAASAGGMDISEPLVASTPQAWSDARGALLRLLEEAAAGAEPEAVTGGVAGVVHDSVLMFPSRNLPEWEGADIADAIKELYPSARVAVENDAAAACLGEARAGAGRGAKIVAYLTVGTGVGGACAVDGAIAPRSAGYEPGNEIIDYASGATVESIASGRAIERKHGAHISEAGDEAMGEVAHALAVMAHNAVAFWSPDVIVFGGSVITGNPGLFERIAKRYGALPAPVPQMPPLKPGALGGRAGLVGALML